MMSTVSAGPQAGRPTPLQFPCCFPTPWAEDAGAACVHSRVDGTIWWLHMQWPRTSVLFPSLKLLVQITDTRSRIAAGVPSSFADDHCVLLQGDFISPWHVTQLTVVSQSLARFKLDLLKSHLKMFWASLLAFPLKKKTNSCIPCLTKLLPWRLVVENASQRISRCN